MENLPNGLSQLNLLQPTAAETEFLKCCGSRKWAQQMSRRLPFRDERDLFETAEQVWWTLSPEDWLEAFRSHPKIGEQKPGTATSASALSWSRKEQQGVADASANTRELLAKLNQRYEEKFGFIYIVCATGKSSEELLTILQERLANESETELRNAAKEQAQITRLRLNKLLASWEQS
ncbi:MAG TPA: 2-oxo-4-hydroxy-4-carboxy-5-ureidoimidazoline decarboxylase [Pyrinomonadaceae bacterium]|nr:2-oxo-4-hydroxy-4-carboxy-5-ureidoimidazoline decarboxylase [Pyrinomonadaceae bacterium]